MNRRDIMDKKKKTIIGIAVGSIVAIGAGFTAFFLKNKKNKNKEKADE